jgi:hypothetical protein
MLTIQTSYTFSNGIKVDFILQKDKNNPIAKANWSCKLNKENISPIMDEYVKNCIPFVYQQIADFTGESILWVDKNGHYLPQRFAPKNKN